MERLIRQLLLKGLTGERDIAFERRSPRRADLHEEFEDVAELGLYLHIPFCEQICAYCPYNKELFRRDVAERYVAAVKTEIDLYANIVRDRDITSFYIGGGTPTTILNRGLGELIAHIRGTFNLQCDIHLESHPNHLSFDNLSTIRSLGIERLSVGVEALQDRHLKTLGRTYTVDGVKEAVQRAVAQNFECVNVDMMFALPEQTREEIEQTGRMLVSMGVDQVAAYPLFLFPYTRMGHTGTATNNGFLAIRKRREMLRILEQVFYHAGFERTSVWAFTRRGVPRYCSVTVPLYLGLGASGGSYLRRMFYLNTFRVSEYIRILEDGRLPVALSVRLTERMQRAGWLYWRIYETRFWKAAFRKRFGNDFDEIYGKYVRLLALLGFLKDDGKEIVLSDAGAFWLHVLEDILSIDYISKLWGSSTHEPWPGGVVL